MPLTSVISSGFRVFDLLVLSVTSHARLSLANEPRDYDAILKRTTREVKFFSETLLTILFFVEKPCLVSQTLACLMFSLITYVALESMTGDGLHKWLNEVPCSRIVLALMTKLPALSVLWTLSALALTQWDSLATKIVLCLVAFVLLAGVFAHFAARFTLVFGKLLGWMRGVTRGVFGEAKTDVGVVAVGGRKRKTSDASTSSASSDATVVGDYDDDGNYVSSAAKEEATLSGDECV